MVFGMITLRIIVFIDGNVKRFNTVFRVQCFFFNDVNK